MRTVAAAIVDVRSNRVIAYLLGLALLSGSPAWAQDHPNRQHGFNPEATYAVGDVDSVNLFNGHLMLRVPLGRPYPVAEGFSYQLGLVYNSSPWEAQTRVVVQGGESFEFVRALPDEGSNAGLGWQLSLGRLDLHGPRPHEVDRFAYVGADGATHVFYAKLHEGDPDDAGDTENTDPFGQPSGQNVMYTRDGSYLRLRVVAGGWAVEFPNGQVHRFDTAGRLTEIADRFTTASGAPSNWLRVDYSEPNVWRISDSHGRSHTVHFTSGVEELGPLVSTVNLAAFGGATATYSMQYAITAVDRECAHTDTGSGGLPVTANLPLLTRITQPDGSTFAMSPSDYLTTAGDRNSCLSTGSLRGLGLPTGGRLEWTYQTYAFPEGTGARGMLERVAGVATRTTKAGGAVLGTWTYATTLNPPRNGPIAADLIWEDLINTVTDPLGHRTRSYFSVYAEAPNVIDAEGWETQDYALPFTRNSSDGQGRFLSTEVFDASGNHLRSTFVRFERDQVDTAHAVELENTTNLNRRLQSEKTVYHTPNASDVELFAEVSHSRFDGLGHYRRTVTSGNFPAGSSRTRETERNAAQRDYRVNPATNTPDPGFTMLAASQPWLLDLVDSEDVTEGAKTARTRFGHDRATGFRTSERILEEWNGVDGCNDVLVQYTADASGNVIGEKRFGGDTQSLCPMPSAPAYEVAHSYQHGVRASSHFLNASGGAMSFKTLDLTIDQPSGLPSSSRDTAGLQTNLLYDTLGRPTAQRPTTGHGAWWELCYAPANASGSCQAGSPAARANVVVRARPNGSATAAPLTATHYVFDALGRLTLERRQRAGGWDVQSSTYDGVGNLSSRSELVREGAFAPVRRFLEYDPFGRPGRISAPDGHDEQLFYDGVFSVTRVGTVGVALEGTTVREDPVSRTQRFDRQGRLWRVVEPSNPNGTDATTTYAYDPLDQLVGVTMQTSSGTQARTFEYDARGFLGFENTPERTANALGLGHDVDYQLYDALGNATRVVEGTNDLSFSFDRAGRLFQVKHTGPTGRLLATYAFGTGTSTADLSNGKLRNSTRFNYHAIGGNEHTLAITQTQVYGGRDGRISQRELSMAFNGSTTERFTQSWRYDDLGNVERLDYPRCTFAPCTDVVPDSFEDVPPAHADRPAIEALYAAGVTAGCGLDPLRYCPAVVTTRRDAAVFVLRALLGRHFQPPPATGSMFNDVPATDWGAAYIEEIARRGITAGCGNGAFCPDGPTTNGQLAVFLLLALHGPTFSPPACTATGFTDVPCSHPFARWIQALAREGRTDGCGGGRFCPDEQVSRAAMADVLVDGFFLPSAQSPATLRSVPFGHTDGLLTSVGPISPAGYATLTYHPNGLVQQVTNTNGMHWVQGNHPQSMRRTGSISLAGTSTATLGDYGYDGQGNVVRIGGSRYLYDKASRVVRGTFDIGDFQAYSYDGFGNLVTISSSKPGMGRNTPSDPTTNRLSGAVSYDASGNLTSWNGAVYQYDAFNQMRRFVSGGQEWLYSYDASGERVFAHRPSTATTLRIDRWSVRDLDGRILRIYEASDFGWRIEKDYVYRGATLLASEAPSEGRRFFYPDHLGSPRQIANEIGGAVSGHHYFPFGEELAPVGRERLKFTGHERDLSEASSPADDLDYMHARHYNPLLGRFLSVDRVRGQAEVPGTWNGYVYALNRPLNLVDPDGNQAAEVWLLATGAGGASGGLVAKLLSAGRAGLPGLVMAASYIATDELVNTREVVEGFTVGEVMSNAMTTTILKMSGDELDDELGEIDDPGEAMDVLVDATLDAARDVMGAEGPEEMAERQAELQQLVDKMREVAFKLKGGESVAEQVIDKIKDLLPNAPKN